MQLGNLVLEARIHCVDGERFRRLEARDIPSRCRLSVDMPSKEGDTITTS